MHPRRRRTWNVAIDALRSRRSQRDGGGLPGALYPTARSRRSAHLQARPRRSCSRLSEWLAAKACTHVAMEATGVYWKPVWHILSDGEFELVLANAAHVKNVPGRKTDVNDATWLADLLAHGLIRGSFVPDEQTQEMRNLLRTRKQLVRERSQPRPAPAKDARGRQHQAGLGHLRYHGPVRPDDDRSLDRRRQRSRAAGPIWPIAGSRRRRRSSARRCAAASPGITASCCACICSRSTPSTT